LLISLKIYLIRVVLPEPASPSKKIIWFLEIDLDIFLAKGFNSISFETANLKLN
jgi:hypothetical protein